MNEFFSSGRAADVVLIVLVAEALWLKFRGAQWPSILGALVPAMLMMIALRAALTGAGWLAIAIALTLAFPIHIYDLRRRDSLRDD